MTWATPHPHAVVIDVDADRAPLVGSRWVRREAAGDDWDSVEICGVFDLGNDSGGLELVIRPLVFGEPSLTASVDSFAEAYRRQDADADDPFERIDARLRALEARG
jgi:hypothetical protein